MKPAEVLSNNPETEQPRAQSSVEGTAGGNVDKIRDILFGSQMKDYETRFSRLEESLLSQTAELRETTRKRFESLEAFVKTELESLQSRLKAEREERCETDGQVSREIKDLGDALSRKLREIEDHNSESERSFRGELLRQSQDLLEQIQARQAELGALLDRRIQDLSSAKTDRALLGALFTEVALRLTDEFHLPGAEG